MEYATIAAIGMVCVPSRRGDEDGISSWVGCLASGSGPTLYATVERDDHDPDMRPVRILLTMGGVTAGGDWGSDMLDAWDEVRAVAEGVPKMLARIRKLEEYVRLERISERARQDDEEEVGI